MGIPHTKPALKEFLSNILALKPLDNSLNFIDELKITKLQEQAGSIEFNLREFAGKIIAAAKKMHCAIDAHMENKLKQLIEDFFGDKKNKKLLEEIDEDLKQKKNIENNVKKITKKFSQFVQTKLFPKILLADYGSQNFEERYERLKGNYLRYHSKKKIRPIVYHKYTKDLKTYVSMEVPIGINEANQEHYQLSCYQRNHKLANYVLRVHGQTDQEGNVWDVSRYFTSTCPVPFDNLKTKGFFRNLQQTYANIQQQLKTQEQLTGNKKLNIISLLSVLPAWVGDRQKTYRQTELEFHAINLANANLPEEDKISFFNLGVNSARIFSKLLSPFSAFDLPSIINVSAFNRLFAQLQVKHNITLVDEVKAAALKEKIEKIAKQINELYKQIVLEDQSYDFNNEKKLQTIKEKFLAKHKLEKALLAEYKSYWKKHKIVKPQNHVQQDIARVQELLFTDQSTSNTYNYWLQASIVRLNESLDKENHFHCNDGKDRTGLLTTFLSAEKLFFNQQKNRETPLYANLHSKHDIAKLQEIHNEEVHNNVALYANGYNPCPMGLEVHSRDGLKHITGRYKGLAHLFKYVFKPTKAAKKAYQDEIKAKFGEKKKVSFKMQIVEWAKKFGIVISFIGMSAGAGVLNADNSVNVARPDSKLEIPTTDGVPARDSISREANDDEKDTQNSSSSFTRLTAMLDGGQPLGETRKPEENALPARTTRNGNKEEEESYSEEEKNVVQYNNNPIKSNIVLTQSAQLPASRKAVIMKRASSDSDLFGKYAKEIQTSGFFKQKPIYQFSEFADDKLMQPGLMKGDTSAG